jgi:fused signal recognition particle receptor
MPLLDKLKERLTKTRANVFGRIASVLGSKTVLDEAMLKQIEEVLITADIGYAVSHRLLERVRQQVRKERITEPSRVYGLLEAEMESLLAGAPSAEFDARLDARKPYVALIVGVNGTGKTTTIGKLAGRLAGAGRKVLLVAGDTFRAAAAGQLEIWAQRSAVQMVRQQDGADPAAVVFDAIGSARTSGFDAVLVDTAGRLHTKTNLMEELRKIHRVIKKQIPDAPHDTILVLDGTTGQNAVQQARQFSQAVPVTGLIVTKLDGTAKGGVVLAIQQELKIPVLFIGVGEGVDDLEEFRPRDFVRAIVE